MEANNRRFSLYQPPIEEVRQKPEAITVTDLVHLVVNNERVRQQTQLVRIDTREDEQAGKEKPGAQAKAAYLQWVIVSGTFSYPNNKGFMSPAYLAVLDIDHLDPAVVEEVKETIYHDDYLKPLLVFRSPRGCGVKAIIAYEETQDTSAKSMVAYHRQQVERIIDYWNCRYAPAYGQPADPVSRDLRRAMWISHDPQALYDINLIKDETNNKFNTIKE